MNSTEMFPLEIVDNIIVELPLQKAYYTAVALRRIFVRDRMLLQLPSATIESACERGKTDLLDWWAARNLQNEKSEHAVNDLVPFYIDTASQYGHINVL